MTQIDDHIKKKSPKIQKLLRKARKIVRTNFPNLTEVISWGYVCYKHNKHIIALCDEKEYIRFEFFYGKKLKDPKGIFSGDGKKMQHVKIYNTKDFDEKVLKDFIKQSIKVDS